MIRRIGMTIFFIVFAFSTTLAFCDVVVKHWEFSKPIHISDYSKKTVAIPLDQQIYDSAKDDLSDLRVVDLKAEELPYAVIAQDETRKDQKLPSDIITKQITQTESIIKIELKEPLKPFNGLKVIPESNNFARKITIEGSNDDKSWEIIRKGIVIYSFAFQMTHKYFEQYTNEIYKGYGFGRYFEENLFMQFPEVSFKFVRVSVPHDQDKEPVELKDLEIYKTIKMNSEEEPFKGSIIKIEPNMGSKSMENIVDFGYKNMPLSRIDIIPSQSNFFRKVEVEGSNDLKKWKSLASAVIFSISVDEETEQSTTVKLGDAKFRYIKINVFNGDNKPIKIASVAGHCLKRFLVIIPEKDVQYRLLYGNPEAKAVNYDTGNVIAGKALDNFGKGKLAKEIRNDKFELYKERKPWTEDKPYILWLVMGIIILGLIFLGSQVIRSMDKGN